MLERDCEVTGVVSAVGEGERGTVGGEGDRGFVGLERGFGDRVRDRLCCCI